MHLHDRLTIDEKRRTRDGYLAVNARVARAGNIQLYSGAEVGKPSMDVVRVFRPADEVFSTDTMQSFAHRPVTLGHPDTSVTSTNWRDVAKGWSDGEVVREGEFVRVSMLLADAEAIDAVENGTRELSMGYDCSLDWTAGTTPAGEAYDAIQRGIRSNHIAVVPKARGGAELRIGDGRGQVENETAYQRMCIDQANAWRGPEVQNRKTQDDHLALDGRHLSALTDRERADDSYRRMCIDQSNAWRGDR